MSRNLIKIQCVDCGKDRLKNYILTMLFLLISFSILDGNYYMYTFYRCSICGRRDIKLYRWYGFFLRFEEVYCKQHRPKEGQFVGLYEGENNVVYGAVPYSQKALEAVEQFNALPDE